MTEDLQKEQFSRAYVRAVTAAAGVNVGEREIDDDSVDITFSTRSLAGKLVPPTLDSQLKCTAGIVPADSTIAFPLKLKNYEELRGPHHTPRILIVLLVPERIAEWLGQSEEQMLLRKCAYWVSFLADAPE